MYFIAIQGMHGQKAINRTLFATKRDAETDILLNRSATVSTLIVLDADHEPGRSILANRHGFA